MFNYKNLQGKTLLIVPSKIKTKIREEIMSLNTLLDIKIMSIDEVKNRLFFNYNKKTVIYLHKTYNKPLSITSNLIDYLYYIDIHKDYKSLKLKELKEIKLDLINNKLLKFDNRFAQNLKQYNIKFLGFTFLSKEDNFILNELNKISNVEVLNYYENAYVPHLTHTHKIEDEIIYVAESISYLLKEGISINNIKLCNVNNDYTFYLKRIFKNYNIPLTLSNDKTLFDLPLSIEFLTLLKEHSKEEAIDILKEKYSDYTMYINKYISILNDISFLDKININYIKHELKNIKLPLEKHLNSIEIIDIEEIGNRDDYIFVVSCNYNNFPSIKKDEDYLIDLEKIELGISTSKEINNNKINSIKTLISSSKNIYLSYKDVSYFKEYHKVDFLDNLEVNEFNKDYLISFSDNEDKLLLAKNLDNNLIDNKTLILNYNYDINYDSYDNSFKGINDSTLNKILDKNNIVISYSSLNNYYDCEFKYFLTNILKLSKFKDSSATIIGKIMHEIVDRCFEDNFNFEECFTYYKNKYIKDYPLKSSEAFFIENIKERTLAMVEFLKDAENYTLLNDKLYEHNICFNKEYKNRNFIIKGFIDKLIYKEINNIMYLAIIDMKSGNQSIDPTLFNYGLGLQLPFYVYLLKNDKEDLRFNNAKVLGLYIHNILNNENNSKTLRYNGYTNSDLEFISILDKTYTSSSLIKGLMVYKNGSFGKFSKLINDDDINNYSLVVENKINEMMEGILNKRFSINPKKIVKKVDSCQYCEYKNICYKSLKDYVYLTSMKEGEDNGLD